MHKRTLFGFAAAVAAAVSPMCAEAEELSEEQIKKIVEQAKPYIEAEVQRRVKEELERQRAAEKPAAPAEAVSKEDVNKIVQETVDKKLEGKAVPVTDAKPWSPSQPISLFRAGSAYINVSVVSDVVVGGSTEEDVEFIEGGHHDPSQSGFSLTGTELTLDGAVDPYFKGQSTISLVIEPGGETVVELEEAWMQTTALPWGLQVRAGQFFADFGRQNNQHNHAWSFVDQPIVSTRLFGPDGLRNPGARLSWLMPTPFYSEFMLGVFDSDGETAYSFRSDDTSDISGVAPLDRPVRGPQHMLYVPRLVSSFDLTETHTVLLGASGAIGPNNSDDEGYTQIYGGDLYWKWKPTNARGGWPFLSSQSEFMHRRYQAPDTVHTWGYYSQLLWGFHERWVAGLRGEYAEGNDLSPNASIRFDRTRLSPALTFHPSEFSKLRLQYNYDAIHKKGNEHSVWLQLEFLLGAHAAHKF